MKTFYIRRYEAYNGYHFFVQNPNARKKSSPIVGSLRCNTIQEAIKALKSHLKKMIIDMET